MALDRLIESIVKLQNPTVAGLDPVLDYVPGFIKEKAFTQYGETLEGASAAILAFNKGLIDALCGVVPAVKPQCAYYELYGWHGVKALHDTINYTKEKGMIVITDGKRNDIGSTMQAYAAAHLGTVTVGERTFVPFGGDALTVNPYLGSDGINPLLDICRAQDKGIFVLVKTSNPSSGELQNQIFEGGETLYGTVGQLCEQWGESLPGKYGYSGVGAVVGATYPAQLAELRRDLPHTFFLVPGYGAQGGGAKDVAAAFDQKGLGAVVNASRSIMTAWKKNSVPETEYAKAAMEEAKRMRDEIIGEIGAVTLIETNG